MKLTKEEYQNLVDSRLVELEELIKEFKDNEPIVSDNENIKTLARIVVRAEALEEAYNAKVDAEMEQQAEEAEKEYQIKFGGDK